MQGESADLEWRDGDIPISTRFDDPYFSLESGLDETRHVFLAGNDLPARFRDGFRIAELGFGTGLNFLTTLLAWQQSGCEGNFSFTSFEAFPMFADEMQRALSAFPELDALASELVQHWATGARQITIGAATLNVIEGDARQCLRRWQDKAEAWYLDGFSPAKNPELWQEDLMAEVARHTAPEGTAATYTAAGFVRRGLETAGFDVTRTPGYGRKRHMTRCTLRAE
ncbi:tRNA 5-methylaminomethyl-2-thiouridine biosynthesis bifunctional protein MnmC [Roseovarius albus]|uniref:tRNA 5-methylaminomethyl-2-thiouridine biosynthesis bifunctional protein MnmC n=2 Tax=Roseovarius albus TaxID=1247867 RepID=A0A1X6ZIU3_9RHOB|nr:tRNA 5-methylaminomethyl-2-thiouridine biosynthesis bifunctional protein MnmC [Roseovarius albus]